MLKIHLSQGLNLLIMPLKSTNKILINLPVSAELKPEKSVVLSSTNDKAPTKKSSAIFLSSSPKVTVNGILALKIMDKTSQLRLCQLRYFPKPLVSQLSLEKKLYSKHLARFVTGCAGDKVIPACGIIIMSKRNGFAE